MENKKFTITPQSVQETMLLPLWGRAKYSQLYPELLEDPEADKIMEKIDYDFSKVEQGFGESGGLSWIIRARNFDNAIKRYIKKYPEATVVNLGCGLDTTFSRVDNGKIKWYDLDLSDAIAFRKKLIPETSRSKCISKSAFDTSWFGDVEYKEEKGIYFLAGGLFHYFKEDKISDLVSRMADKFPGGKLIFDALSKFGLKMANKMIKKTGNQKAEGYHWVNDPKKEISKWSDKIKVADYYPFYKDIKRDSKFKFGTRAKMNINDLFNISRFIELKFEKLKYGKNE